MYILTTITGFLWLIYSIIFLTLNVSISNAPEKVKYIQTVIMLFIVLGIIMGVFLIATGRYQRRRMYFKRIEKVLIRQLIIHNYSVMTLQISLKSGISINFIEKFLKLRQKATGNFFVVDDKGLVSIKNDYRKTVKKGK